MLSFDEGKTPPHLRRTVSTLGCMAKELDRDHRITRCPCPLLCKNAEQVDRRWYLSLGGLPQQRDDSAQGLFVRRLSRQRQGIAKAAFGTVRRCGLLVPFAGFVEVAHGFGPVGQNIGQKRLALRRSGLSGRARPSEGGIEIRIG